MFDFHKDRQHYFNIQIMNTRDSIIPFIKQSAVLKPCSKILEVGCGEGGVLKAFTDGGHTGTGIELDTARLRNGREWLTREIGEGRITLLSNDIFNVKEESLNGPFDLIIMKDVIEHIGNKKALLEKLKALLTPEGMLFIGFPPWQMPFGGHQQMCSGRWLGKTPWIHLLPRPFYKWLLTCFHQPVHELMEIYDCRLSIEGFYQLIRQTGFQKTAEEYFLVAPIYKYKFGWKQRRQFTLVNKIPYLRNFFTTAVYFIIKNQQTGNSVKN